MKYCGKVIALLRGMLMLPIFIKEQLPIVFIVVSYVSAGYIVQYGLGIENMMNLRINYNLLSILTVYFSLFFLSVQILRGNSKKYLNRSSIFGLLAVYMLAAPFLSTFASFKQVIPFIQDFNWDYRFMKLDYVLHFGVHPWEIFSFLLYNDRAILILDYLYMLWFPALFLMCLWMAWSAKRQLRLQFFITVCLIWILLGTVMAIFFSSAGPCYFSKIVDYAPNPYEPLMNQLMKIHESMPLFAVNNQLGLWESYQNRIWLTFGGISAMPSVHVALAVVFTLTVWNINRWFSIIFMAYAIGVQVGAIILGWHYAVDGYLSIILTLLLWKTVGKTIDYLRQMKNIRTYLKINLDIRT
jgi:hypothetical protein